MTPRAAPATLLLLALAACVAPTLQQLCSQVSCFDMKQCNYTVQRDYTLPASSCLGYLSLYTSDGNLGPPCQKDEPTGMSVVACEPSPVYPSPDTVTCGNMQVDIDRHPAGCPQTEAILHATFCCKEK